MGFKHRSFQQIFYNYLSKCAHIVNLKWNNRFEIFNVSNSFLVIDNAAECLIDLQNILYHIRNDKLLLQEEHGFPYDYIKSLILLSLFYIRKINLMNPLYYLLFLFLSVPVMEKSCVTSHSEPERGQADIPN